MVERSNEKVSVQRQCHLLKINRSQLYYTSKKNTYGDVAIVDEMKKIIAKRPYYGHRRMKIALGEKGIKCNRKKVCRIMRQNNIEALYPKKRTSIKNKRHKVHPYLLRDIKITYPNQAWGVDITYIKICGGYVYLIGIIDIYSRKIVGWKLSPFLDKEPCIKAIKEAILMHGIPDITNTDQGCQFTSQEWIEFITGCGSKVSMDGKGRWADNVYIERFWRSLKYELIYLHSFEILEQVKQEITEYILFYNSERPHQSLNYKTPDFVYMNYKPTLETTHQDQQLLPVLLTKNDVIKEYQNINLELESKLLYTEVPRVI
jgi:putative transposase